ncbi:hypothetical protein MHBO_000620 [Bonamia ostreae]|uniref:Uncharacterized protein n=1 Tax=Bonamia ostreae TaxID=126728 RepID=A0ABV2AG80_9EUKA
MFTGSNYAVLDRELVLEQINRTGRAGIDENDPIDPTKVGSDPAKETRKQALYSQVEKTRKRETNPETSSDTKSEDSQKREDLS